MARIGTGKRIAFSLVPLLLGIGLAELVLRATDLADHCPNRFTDTTIWVCDPILQFRLDPQLAPLRVPLNSDGFRGDEWGAKRPRVYRILALGDSCTFGLLQRETYGFVAQPYPLKLQRLVERRIGADRVEVLNAAVPGYNSYQGVLLLRTRLRDLDPDLITVRYGWNDHFLSPEGEGERFFREPGSALGRIVEAVALRTRLYAFARRLALEVRALREPLADQASRAFLERPAYEPTIPVDLYAQNLRRIVEIGRSRGAEVWLLTSPYNPAPSEATAKVIGDLNRLEPDELLRIHDEYNEATRRVGREMDAPVVDMAAVYARHAGAPLFIDTDVPHPAQGGHVLEAETLYAALVQRGVIPSDGE